MSVGAPDVVGALTYPVSGSPLVGGKPGPYLHGTDRWILGVEYANQTALPNLAAYKSTDLGVTYARIVAGPTCSANQVIDEYPPPTAYVTQGLGTTLSVGYQDASGQLKTISFDMATGAFAAANPTGVTLNVSDPLLPLLGNLAHAVQPSGHLILVYYVRGNPLLALRYDGAWSSAIEIDDASSPNFFFENICLNSAGNVVILYGQGSGAAFRFGAKLWAIFDGTNVLSSGATPITAAGDSGTWCGPIYDSASDSVVFPYRSLNNVALPAISLLIGTPSTGPAWTVKVVRAFTGADLFLNGTDTLEYVNVAGNAAGNSFLTMWKRRIPSGDFIVEQSSCTSLTGTWSANSTYYDENVNPPSPPALLTGVGIAPVYLNRMSNDQMGVIVGLLQNTPGFFWSVMYTWGTVSPPAPGTAIQLNATVSGGASSPSDFTITATGPVTVSGLGSLPLTPVPAGTYVISISAVAGYTAGPFVNSGGGSLVIATLTLGAGQSANIAVNEAAAGIPPGPLHFEIVSGSLPPGLTLNPDTGLISGTPTALGLYTYTAKVTDPNGLTATATCSINMSQSAQFELRRVYATLKPHSRIPVRGS